MTTMMKGRPNGDGAIPLPPKASVPLFYKYSSLATPEHLERLRVIVQTTNAGTDGTFPLPIP
jgi:hypothetical protein